MDLFSERFLPLIENSGKTDQELEKSMGLPRSIIYDWKHGRNKSSFKKYAANFSEYFNVSTDYLLGKTDNPQGSMSGFAPETLEFMKRFERLPDDKKKALISFLEAFTN